MVSRRFANPAKRVAIVGAVVVALTPSPATAAGPVDWVDPSVPGSVTDAASASEMVWSNAGATGAGAHEYCFSSATAPAVVYDSESYTRAAVVSRVTFYNTGAYCEERWNLQYFNTRDYAWYNIGSGASFAGGSGSYMGTELRAHCIAGTWLYRVKALRWRTTAKRYTCSDPNDPFRIDS